MNKTEHSPLPWGEHPVDEVQIVSRLGEGEEICTASGDYDHDYKRMCANAQFIVTACNSYYDSQQAIAELVEALGRAKQDLEDWLDCEIEMREDGWDIECDSTKEIIDLATTLIAKHKAKP